MATIPSPVTWTDGPRVTAAKLNTEIRDSINFLLSPPQCKAWRNAALNIPNTTWTLIPFDSESWDNDSMHDNVTNPSRVYANTAGLYEIAITVQFSNTAGGNIRGVNVRKNAAGSATGGTSLVTQYVPNAGSAASTVWQKVFCERLSAGDYLELFGYQDSGAALALSTSSENVTMALRMETI